MLGRMGAGLKDMRGRCTGGASGQLGALGAVSTQGEAMQTRSERGEGQSGEVLRRGQGEVGKQGGR